MKSWSTRNKNSTNISFILNACSRISYGNYSRCFGSQQVNLEQERRYAVKNSGRLSAWGKVKKHQQDISARINKQEKQVGNFHHKKSGQITTVRQNKNFKSWNQKSK
ncbi:MULTISPECIES: hypothetical protein [unclassified Spiroplasma]|uniref:hypothetical protein n=1 Tax=unclassified Spiroplasma TaxID=2637901 RepID=UPI00313EDA15